MIHDDEDKNMRCRIIFGNPLKDNALRCPHRAWLEAVTDHFPCLYHPFAATVIYILRPRKGGWGIFSGIQKVLP